MLNGFDPGALFNDEIATQINEGNFEGFQERFTNSMRASMRQTMTMSATLMRAYGDRLLEQVRGEMQGMFEGRRSEEHTSELQSLMRISYAVFCLNKKNKKHIMRTQ